MDLTVFANSKSIWLVPGLCPDLHTAAVCPLSVPSDSFRSLAPLPQETHCLSSEMRKERLPHPHPSPETVAVTRPEPLSQLKGQSLPALPKPNSLREEHSI